ncbi:recombinase family protein [Helcobacillus sp. ACRRO]|uniref:recombinase family protein n=1 Tax=Helcobacillus TaxID=1161125 RepID=UPI001EF6F909|nr:MULTISPECIES: recombinase family protein [Helcobacillus]MCG7427736.1 recombinase family protein [Helcobacillus sp. ACRRO]MDK7742906.1 recombinase family protein [Helcobacillus massiliensis]WOO93557.1 recombinase family protein [Helcobacillus massiliensis]
MSRYFGYARVSTSDQRADSQIAALHEAGAEQVWVDVGLSSRTSDRPQWLACRAELRSGDVLLVRALDRIAGTERMAIEVMRELEEEGVHLRSLTEPAIDTTTAQGRALSGFLAVLSQLRVDLIRENTRRGLAHAREQGRVGGRPTVMTPERVEAAVALQEQGKSLRAIAEVLGVSASSVGRAIRRRDSLS